MSHLSRSVATRVAVAVAVVLAAGVVLGGCKDDPKLKVTRFEPTEGDFAGGERVTIYGNRFAKDGVRNAKVYFGNKEADVIKFEGDDKLIVKAPAGNPGEEVDILIIFEPGGEITPPQKFKYVAPTQADVKDLGGAKKP
jgi:hypothetical protein